MSVEKFNPRITRESIPYVQINTKVVQNITNMEAGFVWIYLQTLPEDWTVVKEHLRKHFGIGQDKVKKIFSYLRKNNLIEYVRERRSNGHLGTSEVRVLNGSRFPITTGVENHPMVNHTCGKPTTTKNINKQIKEKETKRATRSQKLNKNNDDPVDNSSDKKLTSTGNGTRTSTGNGTLNSKEETKRRNRASSSQKLNKYPDDFWPDNERRALLTYHACRTNQTEEQLLEKFEAVSKRYKTKATNWNDKFEEFLIAELPKKVYEDEKGQVKRYDGVSNY